MKRLKETDNGQSSIASLKKRLFTLASYLIVTAALLLYVSYGSYRLQVDGEVIFSQAGRMEAYISLDPNTTDVEANTASASFIVDLTPGNASSTYAADETESVHKMTLTVSNYSDDADGEPCEIGLDYHVVLKGEGNLMLGLTLKDSEGNTYQSRRTGGYGHYEYRFYPNTTSNTEVVFHFDANTAASHTLYIYAGWDNTGRHSIEIDTDEIDPYTNQPVRRTVTATDADQVENGRYRKEVEDLQICAEIMNSDPGHTVYETAPTVPEPSGGGE